VAVAAEDTDRRRRRRRRTALPMCLAARSTPTPAGGRPSTRTRTPSPRSFPGTTRSSRQGARRRWCGRIRRRLAVRCGLRRAPSRLSAAFRFRRCWDGTRTRRSSSIVTLAWPRRPPATCASPGGRRDTARVDARLDRVRRRRSRELASAIVRA
jgi:hypothetical protein